MFLKARKHFFYHNTCIVEPCFGIIRDSKKTDALLLSPFKTKEVTIKEYKQGRTIKCMDIKINSIN